MNIEKADYGTIIKLGTLEDLKNKMRLNNEDVGDIVDYLDNNGMSLLEQSIVARKFEISRYLLDNNAKVNIVSREGNNEFHFLAANINCDGAIDIAKLLLSKGTSVMQKEKKYGNTAFFTLCLEAFKERSAITMEFIEKCFEKVTNVDEENVNGITIRKLISERGNNSLKRIMEKKYE